MYLLFLHLSTPQKNLIQFVCSKSDDANFKIASVETGIPSGQELVLFHFSRSIITKKKKKRTLPEGQRQCPPEGLWCGLRSMLALLLECRGR